MFWQIMCISNTIFNVFASVVLALAIYRVGKQKKQVKQPVYKKYGSK